MKTKKIIAYGKCICILNVGKFIRWYNKIY